MRFLSNILIAFLLLISSAKSQNSQDWLSGYFSHNDSISFLFSESIYQISPAGVVVTGAFRGWSQDLKDPNYQLQKISPKEWKLTLANPKFQKVKPGMPFKFRTSEGKWLSPPKDAPNIDGGNLAFMKGFEPLNISAGLNKEANIEVHFTGLNKDQNFTINLQQFLLEDASGNQIKLSKIEHITPPKTSKNTASIILQTEKPIDNRRVYYLKIPALNQKVLCSWEPWFKDLKSTKELGANPSPNYTSFRVFAPRATLVKLYIYDQKDQKEPSAVYNMSTDSQGVWEFGLNQNLEGSWYDFTVHGFPDPGNFFFETHPVHVSDPYARVSDDSFGKCRVTKKTIPATPLKNGPPPLEKVLAYEVHIQDFTWLLPVSNDLKGTIPAMTTPNLKNEKGHAIGFDYLTQLGINAVHLMPVQEMLHWPKDEWEQAFKNDPYMIEQGVNKENYDWGYRTSHSFAIESRYRQKNTEPGQEREQFKNLVQNFHQKNIAVIVDLVFNHTAENMDGRSYLFHFNAFDKQYYYRTKNLEHIGEYGNETKSENRYFVQRWIIDQCKQLIEEFGVDGFRIDLAGQTDKQTLQLLKKELPPNIIIYGEPWIDSNDPNYNKNPDWHWYKEDAPICYFNDDTRNTYKGPVFELNNKATDRGWAGGNSSLRDDVKLGLTCGFPTQKNINSAINYLDIHDNFALADQFATSNFDGRFGVDEINYKIAATLLFTTPGPIVLHGGSEMMRSKGMAPLIEIEKEIPSGKLQFHGKRDTYNMRNANLFVWDNVGKTLNKKQTPNTTVPYQNADYLNMTNYWKNLIELRKRYLLQLPQYQFNSNNPDLPHTPEITFIEPQNLNILGYIIENRVFVMLNTGQKMQELEINLPKGKWKLIGNTNEIALDAKFAEYHQSMMGGLRKYIVEPYSINIWVRD
jgi:pullulanase/glycogen debranching enzyme